MFDLEKLPETRRAERARRSQASRRRHLVFAIGLVVVWLVIIHVPRYEHHDIDLLLIYTGIAFLQEVRGMTWLAFARRVPQVLLGARGTLDERDQHDRDRAYRLAYHAMMVVVGLGGVYALIAWQTGGSVARPAVAGTVVGTVIVSSVLMPWLAYAWVAPDPIVDEPEPGHRSRELIDDAATGLGLFGVVALILAFPRLGYVATIALAVAIQGLAAAGGRVARRYAPPPEPTSSPI